MVRYTIISDSIIEKVAELLDIPAHMAEGIDELKVSLRRDHPVEFTMSAEVLKKPGEEH